MYVNETLKFIVNKNRGCDTFLDGKTVYYSLADDHVSNIMKQGLEHVCE